MLFSSILFIGILIYSAFAVELNIYTTVTEVRQSQNGVGTYNYVFNNGQYSNIIQGSISWNGTPFVSQVIYNTNDGLKGAAVTVRRSDTCECNIINAKVVDPNTMLLENVDTGAYFYADTYSIDYTTKKPNSGGTTLTIEFEDKTTDYNGTLSYLTRGITWTPNYDLFVTDPDICTLRGYANIANNQQQSYQIDNTYLYSGDLQLVNTNSQPIVFKSTIQAPVATMASASTIQLSGEEKGFYFYSLTKNYVLRSSSSIRLPFITLNPKCHFYYKTTVGASAGQYNGVFTRTYDITPEQFVPSGVITVRDNGVLLGQANLPDTPDNYTQTLTFGQDNDVRYTINGNQTAGSPNNANITWRTYVLAIKISNYKDKSVNGQLDISGAIKTSINSTTCGSASINANTIILPFNINANGKYKCQLTVTLSWG